MSSGYMKSDSIKAPLDPVTASSIQQNQSVANNSKRPLPSETDESLIPMRRPSVTKQASADNIDRNVSLERSSITDTNRALNDSMRSTTTEQTASMGVASKNRALDATKLPGWAQHSPATFASDPGLAAQNDARNVETSVSTANGSQEGLDTMDDFVKRQPLRRPTQSAASPVEQIRRTEPQMVLARGLSQKTDGAQRLEETTKTDKNFSKTDIPTWRGVGPRGVCTLNARSQSNAAFNKLCPPPNKRYQDERFVEFVFDMKTRTMAVGDPRDTKIASGLSPHQMLAVSIGAESDDITFISPGADSVVGGLFTRNNDTAYTSENSGHYHENWNSQRREEFVNTMRQYGAPVSHSGDYAFDFTNDSA